MKKNVLELLERSAELYPEKNAVEDGGEKRSYRELREEAESIGAALSGRIKRGEPVAILSEKSCRTLAAMFGVVYAGGFYVSVSPDQPSDRVRRILAVLESRTVIADSKYLPLLTNAGYEGRVLDLGTVGKEEPLPVEERRALLAPIREKAAETDLLYGIFTSGSTGNPKGVVVSHGAVIRFIGHFTELFGITEEDRIANQAPFDFDVSVKDIYSAIAKGASLVLVQRALFSTPPRLLDYLEEKKVTNLTWAVSALCLVSGLKGLDYKIPATVKRILFSGEVMPVKHLRMWQKALPDCAFVNLYGPSEITCNCTYYRIGHVFEDGEKIPIGIPFPKRHVFLMGEDGRQITDMNVSGEICVGGESLSSGYYNDPEQTAEKFITFTAEDGSSEPIYKTGDLGYLGEDGNLYFDGRKDFQIKHMGHRIELEGIDATLSAIEGVVRCCTIYDREKNRIVAFYTGDAEKKMIRAQMKEKLPVYMIPNKWIRLEEMPLTKNGKIDRKAIAAELG
ncbi:MAG: amino acid adenylation domain-containing protein [Eubacterium sp.]|nr:amino acid adenylation domain-containing protein [Eubacterium sp.]